MDDLLAEYLEDLVDEDEDMAREFRLKYLGYEVRPSGDPVIDMWEKQMSQGQIPDLSYGEPDNSKERDERIRKAARRFYAEHGRSSLFKAPAPEMSIEDIEEKRAKLPPDMRQYGVPDESEMLFNDAGYPMGSGDLTPEAFDNLGAMAKDGFKSLDLEALENFAEVGGMFKKK